MTIDEARQLKVGDRITRPNYIPAFWREVRGVQERGLVVSLMNGSHKQLLEWSVICDGPDSYYKL